MSWLCDVCGYENEYSDESKNTICLCCGEPAPEFMIRRAQHELEEFHRKEERRASFEELKRKQEMCQQIVVRFVKGITRAIKAISVAFATLIIVAIVWIGISMHSDDMTLLAWERQMNSNIKLITISNYLEMLKGNLTVADVDERTITTIYSESKSAGNQIVEQYSVVSKNLVVIGNMKLDNISFRSSNLRDNIQLLFEYSGDDIQSMGQSMPVMGRNISELASNLRNNWSLFVAHVQDNFQELISSIKRK